MNCVINKIELQKKLHAIRGKVLINSNYNLLDFSLDDYTTLFKLENPASYGQLNKKIFQREKYINKIDSELANLFNQYLLLTLLDKFDFQSHHINFPASIKKKYHVEISRIENQLTIFHLDFYQLNNDKFLKDLAILSHWLIPMGAEFIVPCSGVPRSLLLKKGINQFCKFLWCSLVCGGGFYPYLELHAHPLSMDEFNPKGWLQTYINLAEFLEDNPIFRGVISSSWFLDPALNEISPHLSYLREIPEKNGATILFNCWDDTGDSGALDNSRSRRKLFQIGSYKPAIYTRIWPRKKLISFKNRMLSRR